MITPWGVAQTVTTLAPGIQSVSTAQHGGIHLDAAHAAQMTAAAVAASFLRDARWWEEDCDWTVPYLHFAEEIGAYLEAQGDAGALAQHVANLDCARGLVAMRAQG